MGLSHCITDGIKTCNNNGLGLKAVCLCFNEFSSFVYVFISIYEFANYICKLDILLI